VQVLGRVMHTHVWEHSCFCTAGALSQAVVLYRFQTVQALVDGHKAAQQSSPPAICAFVVRHGSLVLSGAGCGSEQMPVGYLRHKQVHGLYCMSLSHCAAPARLTSVLQVSPSRLCLWQTHSKSPGALEPDSWTDQMLEAK